MQITRPGFLDYNGPVPSELGVVPFPPDFDTMTPDQQREARALHEAQTLHNIYQLCTSVKNPAAFTAMQNQESVRHQASVLPGLTLTDSEPCLNGLLREVKEDWPEIVGIGSDGTPLEPCPLQFSSTEVEQQERDEALWAQGVDLMDEFLRETGGFKHWDGRVSNENYEHLKKQWVEGVEEFLKREAKTKEERMAWLKVLPFVD